MNTPFPRITESPNALHKQMRAKPDPKKRQRLQALDLVASGQAPSRLARAAGLAAPRHTIRPWLKLYEPSGVPAGLTIEKAPGKVSAVTAAVRIKLQACLTDPRGFASYGEIQQYLARAHPVHLSYSAVHPLGRDKLQAKPKAPRRSHPKKSPQTSLSFGKPSGRNSPR